MRNAFDFVFDLFEILIVFVIVSFELSLPNESSFCKFLFFLESDEREPRASRASALGVRVSVFWPSLPGQDAYLIFSGHINMFLIRNISKNWS